MTVALLHKIILNKHLVLNWSSDYTSEDQNLDNIYDIGIYTGRTTQKHDDSALTVTIMEP